MKRLSRIFCVVLAIAVLSAAAVFPSYAGSKSVTSKGNYNYTNAQKVFKIMNKERKKRKLKPLKLDKNLTKSAMLRAAEIQYNYSHTRPNGTKCTTAFKWTGSCGENITRLEKTAAKAMKSWMKSKGHKKNILRSDFTRVGVGCFVNSYGDLFWVQCFSGGSAKVCKTKGVKCVTVKIALQRGGKTTVKYEKKVPKIKSVKLSKASVVFNGKNQKYSLKVKDTKGRTVPKKYYRVSSYPDKFKEIGTYEITVMSVYRAEKFTMRFKILPPTPKIFEVNSFDTGATVSWEKLPGGVMGYEVECSDNPDFKGAKWTYTQDTSCTFDWLDGKTDYYFRVRGEYFTYSGSLMSDWSNVVKHTQP